MRIELKNLLLGAAALIGMVPAYAAEPGESRVGQLDRLSPGGLFKSVDAERDRGDGRIVDEQTWELDRLEAIDLGVREFDLLEAEQDRDYRIARKAREDELDSLGRTERIFDVLPIIGGEEPAGAGELPDAADEAALLAAGRKYDQIVFDSEASEKKEIGMLRERLKAENRLDELPVEEARIRAVHQKKRAEAAKEYFDRQGRLFGSGSGLESEKSPESATDRIEEKGSDVD